MSDSPKALNYVPTVLFMCFTLCRSPHAWGLGLLESRHQESGSCTLSLSQQGKEAPWLLPLVPAISSPPSLMRKGEFPPLIPFIHEPGAGVPPGPTPPQMCTLYMTFHLHKPCSSGISEYSTGCLGCMQQMSPHPLNTDTFAM